MVWRKKVPNVRRQPASLQCECSREELPENGDFLCGDERHLSSFPLACIMLGGLLEADPEERLTSNWLPLLFGYGTLSF